MTFTRRQVLQATSALVVSPLLTLRHARAGAPALRLTGVELLPIRATARTVWLIVRLRTDTGLTGLGEASDAFGFANTTAANAETMRARLQMFFGLVRGSSPLDVERYRQRGMPLVKGDLVSATAFSEIEQAMWDLAGQALDVPTYALIGGKVRPGRTVNVWRTSR